MIGRRGFIAGLAGLIGSIGAKIVEEKPGVYRRVIEKPTEGQIKKIRSSGEIEYICYHEWKEVKLGTAGSRMVCLKCGWAPLDDDEFRTEDKE